MFIINLLGQLVGFAITIGIIVLIVKSFGFHPDKFELEENEEIVKMVKANHLINDLLVERQNGGEVAFTNKRFLFAPLFFAKNNIISIPYDNIAEIKKSFVKIFPIAITIVTKDNQEYKFSMLKRQMYIDLIYSMLNKEEKGE